MCMHVVGAGTTHPPPRYPLGRPSRSRDQENGEPAGHQARPGPWAGSGGDRERNAERGGHCHRRHIVRGEEEALRSGSSSLALGRSPIDAPVRFTPPALIGRSAGAGALHGFTSRGPAAAHPPSRRGRLYRCRPDRWRAPRRRSPSCACRSPTPSRSARRDSPRLPRGCRCFRARRPSECDSEGNVPHVSPPL